MLDQKYLDKLKEAIKVLIREYESIHTKIKWGKIGYTLYGDYFEIANYQINSLQTVLDLNEKNKYRDAFIILRTIFENYLMFLLMTRGKYYLRFFTKQKGETIDQAITRINSEISLHKLKTGDKKIIKARKSQLYKGKIEVVYEGPYINGKKRKGNLVPIYYYFFQEFDPETAFLDTKGYLDFLSSFPKINKRRLERKKEQLELYKLFLRFEAILYSLRLNKLSNTRSELRIKAHYNFLSQTVHPSKRGLSIIESRRHYAYINRLEDMNKYDSNLNLLLLLYCGYLICGYSEALLCILENAPKKYIQSIDSSDIKRSIRNFYSEYDYFWFIYNRPHEYDKFQFCVSCIGTKKKTRKLPEIKDPEVPFNKNILGRLKNLQSGWRNKVCGTYTPPF